MFKRLEKKRKRREEDEELGLDQDMGETFALNHTDSDESDSDSDADTDGDEDQAEEGDGIVEDPPMSVAEALKDPIYLISFDPTVYGCVLCKAKLIKSSGIAAVHKNANAHKRRFEHFRRLSAGVDPHSDAWELVKAIGSASNVQKVEPQGSSKRALKRQVKDAEIREKRQRHRELKTKAIAKKALKRLSTIDETRSTAPSTMDFRSSPESQIKSGKTWKKRLESDAPVNTITGPRDVTTKSASRIKTSSNSRKMVPKSKLKSTR